MRQPFKQESVSFHSSNEKTVVYCAGTPLRHFLNQKHTINNLDEEHYYGELFDRDSYPLWVDKGKPELQTKANTKVRHILSEHPPLELDPTVEKELLKIVNEVEKRELGSTL